MVVKRLNKQYFVLLAPTQ